MSDPNVPSDKSPTMENFLEELFGRSSAITEGRCLPLPIGCGKPVEGFRDELSAKEYRISGLCQTCQDEVFGG